MKFATIIIKKLRSHHHYCQLMNPDFVNERKNSSFSTNELEIWIDGSAERTALKHRVQQLAEKESCFRWNDLIHLDRSQLYRRGLQVCMS
jgi:hypothetical protein